MSGDASTIRKSSSPIRRPKVASAAELRTDPYESVASLILSLLMMFGLVVIALLTIWLSSKIFIRRPPALVTIADVEGGGGDGGEPGGTQLEEPSAEDFAGEADLPITEVTNTLALVAQTVATTEMPELSFDDAPSGKRGLGSYGTGGGRGGGSGSGSGGPGISREKRWEIQFIEGSTIETYAEQLDFFKIELAAIVKNAEVVFAWNFTQPTPSTRAGSLENDKRLYFTWRQGALRQADRELMRRAGVTDSKGVILQFYSPELENQLAHLEKNYRGLDAIKIRKTRFSVRQLSSGYEFFVLEQHRL